MTSFRGSSSSYFSAPPPPPGDLRERITGRRRSPSRSRSRSRSYSPPPPPSHPSRQVDRRSLTASASRYSSARREVRREESRRSERERERSHRSVRSERSSRKSHKKKSSRKKSKRKSRHSSSSSSSSSEERRKSEKRSSIKHLRHFLESIENNGPTDQEKQEKKKRHSRDSISSRDEPSTSVSDEKRSRRSASVLPANNPIEAKSEFKPTGESEGTLPGYCKCQICSTYFPADMESRHKHLSQHADRLFMVTVPTDKFFYNIEEVIKHLARMKFPKSSLQEKVQQCNLLELPTDLRGFSCDISKELDTTDIEIFHSHVKNECKIRDKIERLSHLVSFCRGCQGRFDNPDMLEAHIEAGPCWPKKRTINRLYDEVEHESSDSAHDPTAAAAEMLRIKQEQVEAEVRPGHSQDPVAVKRERLERGAAVPPVAPDVSSQYQPASVNPGLFLTPDTPSYGPPPPSASSQFSQSNPPYLSQGGSPWLDILNNIRQKHNTQGDPSYSNYSPPPALAPAPAQAPGIKPEPSPVPASQPAARPLISPVRQRTIVRPPPPGEPLPSLGVLFAQQEERRGSPEEKLEVFEVAKSASSLNCSRLLCDWNDPHVESCQRLKIQVTCERKACTDGGLHALGLKSSGRGSLTPCPRLQKSCSGKYPGLKRILPQCFNSVADTSCQEKKTISMRLLYRRSNDSLKDPRIGRNDYASNSQHIAAKILQTKARGGAKWGIDTIISTWSAINMIKVVPGDNPNLQNLDSDHESDIECLD